MNKTELKRIIREEIKYLKNESFFDRFKGLPKEGSVIKVAGKPVEITYGKTHVGFTWTSSDGKERYEESNKPKNLHSLIDTIKGEIEYVENKLHKK